MPSPAPGTRGSHRKTAQLRSAGEVNRVNGTSTLDLGIKTLDFIVKLQIKA